MLFSKCLKNMDILLNYDGVTDHLGFKDEPVKSDLKVEKDCQQIQEYILGKSF